MSHLSLRGRWLVVRPRHAWPAQSDSIRGHVWRRVRLDRRRERG
ncbi:hypothetical protein [Rothia sp. P7208]